MGKYIPTIIAAGVAIAGILADPIQAWVSAHPAISAALAGVAAIIAHFLPSPTAKS